MPDERTQDALDALADLFLTGLVPAAPSEADDAAAARARRRAARRASDMRLDGPAPIRLGPKLRSASPQGMVSGEAPADGMPPTPDPLDVLDQAADVLASAGADLDEAAAAPYLRLRRDDDSAGLESDPADASATGSATSAASAPPSVLVEAVILGNLPGFGGAWLTQYAGLLAQQDGPVAIVHVGDDGLDLELVEPFDDARESFPAPPSARGLVDLLDALTRRAESPVRTVLIHHDLSPDSLAEGGMERLLAAPGWTILAGADDAAVFSVCRALRTLVDADPAAARQRVGLMVMGSEEGDSRAAADRVRTAADEFLQTPIELIGWQKRMVPVAARELGSFDSLETLWPGVRAWIDTLVQPELELRDTPPTPTPAPGRAAAERMGASEAASAASPAKAASSPAGAGGDRKRHSIFTGPLTPRIKTPLPPPRRPGRRPAMTVATAMRSAAPRPVAAMDDSARIAPAPAPAPAAHRTSRPDPIMPSSAAAHTAGYPGVSGASGVSRASGASGASGGGMLGEPDLAQLLIAPASNPGMAGSIPGGIGLDARCPHQPEAQLVVDQLGRLHLLHRAAPTPAAGREGMADRGLDALRAAVLALLEVRGWVGEHGELLQLTQRQLRLDLEQPPQLHLFTDRADLAVPLANRLGELLKLHLLQPVHVGQQSTWFSTPLC